MAASSTPSNTTPSLDLNAMPGLKSVTLKPGYVPARLPAGKVVGVWGVALVRTPDGEVHQLQVGEFIKKGDVIMTSQDGIVQIEADGTRLARGPAGDELEPVLAALDDATLDIAPAAGLTGGDSGGLLEGLRITRITEVVGASEYSYDTATGSSLVESRDTATLSFPVLGVTAATLSVPESAAATPGSFIVTAPEGLASVTVGGTTLTAAQLATLTTSPVTLVTTAGTLVLSGYDAATGTISYTYDPNTATHTSGAAIGDSFAVTVTDVLGNSSSGDLLVSITDTGPAAVADANTVTEDATLASASGNVISAVGNSPAGGADVLGADAATVSGVIAGSAASASGNVGSALAGAYGSLTLNADGSYAYALDNANAAVNALKDGVSLSDTFTYTLTDADGSTSTTTLVITVAGHTDGVPTVVVPDTDGNANGGLNASDLTVSEAAGPTPGSFSISAPDGLASLSVGGTVLSPAQLSGLGSSPVSIATGEGTLVLTGYDAATGVVSYTYDPSAQTSPTTVIDAITLVVTDAGGASVSGSLDIAITDTGLSAVADANTVTEDATLASASGNVISAVGNSPAGGADVLGADAATVSGVVAGSAASASGNVGSALAGAYGSLTLNADGSYAYALDNANAAVNALKDGVSLSDTFTYTLTDADGSTSTTTLVITVAGHTDGVPTVVVPDTDGNANGGLNASDLTVSEAAGPTPGSFSISAPDGLASLSVGGTVLSPAQLSGLGTSPVSIATGEGTLVLTGYDAATGVVSYTYDPSAQTSPTTVIDAITLVVTDAGGASVSGSLDIAITDTGLSAVADANTVTEDATLASASGNVISAVGNSPAGGADVLGADAATVSGVVAGSAASASGNVGSALAGAYGSLTLNADGSYAYALDNANAAVNALKDGVSLSDTFTYTLTDADGSTSTTTLVITVAGHTDGVPTVVVPDTDGNANGGLNASDLTVSEAAGPTPGSFSISAPDGLASLSVGGTVLSPAQLSGLGSSPVSIATGEGTLVLTGYDAATGVVSYTYDPSAQTSPTTVIDAITLVVTDAGGASVSGSLDIAITDTGLSAVADANTVTEDATLASASGNVISAVGNSPAGGADVLGADAATVSGVVAGSAASASGNVGSALAGAYGSLTLNADGSYAYALDNANAAVNALKDGVSLSDTFTYTLTDADGSTSTTTLVITVAGHTDGVPTVVVPDTDGNANGGLNASDLTVSEAAGPTPGSFSISAPDGLASLSVGGTVLSPAQLSGLGTSPVSIATGEGTLVLTGYDAATGVVSYTYDPSAQTSPTTVIDAITLVVTDAGGASVSGSLDIAITDTGLSAVADANTVTEDATLASASGNVISAVGNSPAGGADVLGADAATVSGVIAGSAASASGNVGSALAGAYGSLTLNADGSYAYALDNANAAVNALKDGVSLSDTFTYTLTDADGSTSTTTLVITVAGHTDGVPTVVVPDTDGNANGGLNASDLTVSEAAGPTPGSFSISAPDGLASLSVGGTVLSPAQLSGLGSSPVSIATGEGTLVLTGYDAATGVVSYTYDPSAQTSPTTVIDAITLVVTDAGGASVSGSLDIAITDTGLSAVADANTVTEDATLASASGNVISAVGNSPAGGADVLGADAATVSGVIAGSAASASGNVGSALAGAYGSLTLNADGSYAYALDNANAAVNALNVGQVLKDVFTYRITDADGSTSTALLTLTINGANDAPSVVTINTAVSEEGLSTGLVDTLGSPTDTTNATLATGALGISDPDGTLQSVRLVAPSGADLASYKSGGVTLSWTLSADGTQLIGGVPDKVVVVVTIAQDSSTGAWKYTVNLQGSIDHSGTGEDVLLLPISLLATDDSGATSTSTLNISLEDDSPSALVPQVAQIAMTDTNLMIVLDVSGSMTETDGFNGQTRLETAIASIKSMLALYDGQGEVKVRLVTFSTSAAEASAAWLTVSEANAALDNLLALYNDPFTNAGYTNYHAALSTAMAAFTDSGALTTAQNVTYFISDGLPNIPDASGTSDITAAEQAAWTAMLDSYDMLSFAIGVGSDVATAQGQTALNPLAWDGTSGTDTNATIVSTFSQLSAALAATLPAPVNGNLISGTISSASTFGGDKGHMLSLTVDGITYTYAPAGAGAITVTGGTSAGVFDTVENVITITTTDGGVFKVDLDDGNYSYTSPSNLSAPITDVMSYVVIDKDGDTQSSSVTVVAGLPSSSTSSTSTAAAASFLGTSGADSYAGTGLADSAYGGDGNDILLGSSGNDLLHGGAGDDRLSGGTGNDQLTGGLGKDVFEWHLGDAGTSDTPAVDTITDFDPSPASSGGDILDLRDLLSGEGSGANNSVGNLDNYLDFGFSTSGTETSTTIHISSQGGFSSGVFSAAAEDQTIVLSGVDLRSSLSLTSSATDAQIIEALLQQGKLVVDPASGG